MQDVGLLVGNKDNEQLFQRLVNITDMVGLDSGVLLTAAGQLWEGGDQTLNPGPRHLPKLARDERLFESERKKRMQGRGRMRKLVRGDDDEL